MLRFSLPKSLFSALALFSLLLLPAVPAHAQDLNPADEIAGQSDSEIKVNKQRSAPKAKSNKYIVRMSEEPVVAYKGGIPGLRATKPARGQKINPNSPEVVRYVGYLDSRHNEALSRVGGQKLYDYRYSFNGFAAKMSLEQAQKMLTVDGVLVVNPDQLHTVDTSSTPTFLGLDAPGGLWSQLGGVGSAGEGIIIGVVDSGVWPESLSFTDRD